MYIYVYYSFGKAKDEQTKKFLSVNLIKLMSIDNYSETNFDFTKFSSVGIIIT